MSDFNTADMPIDLVWLTSGCRDAFTDSEIAERVNRLNIPGVPKLTARQIRTMDEWLERNAERELAKVRGEKAERESDIQKLHEDLVRTAEFVNMHVDNHNNLVDAWQRDHNALTAVINYLSLPWWKRAFRRYRGSE